MAFAMDHTHSVYEVADILADAILYDHEEEEVTAGADDTDGASHVTDFGRVRWGLRRGRGMQPTAVARSFALLPPPLPFVDFCPTQPLFLSSRRC